MTFRNRKLDADGDVEFGRGQLSFLIDSPAAVAQAVMTRLRLEFGEWFVDTSDGTDWSGQVLGKYTQHTRDFVIRERVLLTPFVTAIQYYYSTIDPNTRRYSVTLTIETQFGLATVEGTL